VSSADSITSIRAPLRPPRLSDASTKPEKVRPQPAKIDRDASSSAAHSARSLLLRADHALTRLLGGTRLLQRRTRSPEFGWATALSTSAQIGRQDQGYASARRTASRLLPRCLSSGIHGESKKVTDEVRPGQALRQIAVRDPIPRALSGRSKLVKFGRMTLLRRTTGISPNGYGESASSAREDRSRCKF